MGPSAAIAGEAAKALPAINDAAINDRNMSFIIFPPVCCQSSAGPGPPIRPPAMLNSKIGMELGQIVLYFIIDEHLDDRPLVHDVVPVRDRLREPKILFD